MTYLRKLIQRLSSKTPTNTLLPNANGWGGVIDPFENAQYLPPVYPQTNNKHSAKHAEIEHPLPTPPEKQTPIAEQHQLTDMPQRVSETSLGEPHAPRESLTPRESPEKLLYQQKPRKIDPPIAAQHHVPVESIPRDRSMLNTDNKSLRVPQHNYLSPWQPPQATQWVTRWLRRYLSDTATVVEGKKIGTLNKGANEQQMYWILPHKGLASLIQEEASTVIHPIPKLNERRALKRRQPQQPQLVIGTQQARLVIGKLTVDVVPIKPARAPQRRKAAVKKRAKDKRGELTQAESARFGFGIGQM
jgi:hypothetical protein